MCPRSGHFLVMVKTVLAGNSNSSPFEITSPVRKFSKFLKLQPPFQLDVEKVHCYDVLGDLILSWAKKNLMEKLL